MKSSKLRGFTLIELIVSIAIFCIIMVPCSMMVSMIIHYNSIEKSKVSNAAMAQNIVEYYRTVDFSKVTPDFNTNSVQYEYITYNSRTTNDTLFANLNTSLSKVGSLNNESYTEVINKVPSPVKNYVIKVVFTYTNEMIKIDTIVWDSVNKDLGKIEYVTLKRY
ncbi:type II secretion system GspH family protein [Clostridium estertheticum]|uniref:type II secretion system protein n=1 Tax=Clostridium estertheticum TaxID=238834 RepID=UPI001C6E72C9|nr:type II secretion system protein [Clostridium estertheticum]MBW9169655.1 type II secretion system GspH family protein [Clostridium estertheticum]WLC74829.1 type II secretion system GspH family protein [Clostridium estertheticum]